MEAKKPAPTLAAGVEHVAPYRAAEPSIGSAIEQLLARVHGLEVTVDHLQVRVAELEAASWGDEPQRRQGGAKAEGSS